MKRIVMILAVTMLCTVTASAQRYLPGQRGIEITGGIVDGFRFKPTEGARFYGNLSMSTYNRKGNRWVFGAGYLQHGFAYRGVPVPVAQFTVEGGHYLKFLSDPSKTVFLSVGGSALLGYESLNRGNRRLYDGAVLTGGDGFIYGAAVSLEIETFITDRVVFLVRARERMMFGGETGIFKFQLGAGIKIIIH
jgi:hypothetical protein